MAIRFEECEGAEQSPPVEPNGPNIQSDITLNLIIQGQSRLQVFKPKLTHSTLMTCESVVLKPRSYELNF